MDLTTLLIQCNEKSIYSTTLLITIDNDIRKPAEEKIKELRKSNPIEFIYGLAQVLGNEKVPEPARYMSSILFKNTILSSVPNPNIPSTFRIGPRIQRSLDLFGS